MQSSAGRCPPICGYEDPGLSAGSLSPETLEGRRSRFAQRRNTRRKLVRTVGSSYDRTTYGFEIETSGEQDEALILKLNSSSSHSHFHLLTRNCADFVKNLINLYQPKAVHRSYVADLGISTPQQMSKALLTFSASHPELRLSRFIIPQVPGNIARSETVHRVV